MMSEQDANRTDRVRTAELAASLSLATDLGMGLPFEHGLNATVMAMRLADLLGVDSDTARQVFYASLLSYSGCTTDADLSSRIFAGGLTTYLTPVEYGTAGQRLGAVLRAVTPPDTSPARKLYERTLRMPAAGRFQRPHYVALCEVAEMLAERLCLPSDISVLFRQLTERWDGSGVLARSQAEEIPQSLRIVHIAKDITYQRLIHPPEIVAEVIRSRAGGAFDPDMVQRFVGASAELAAVADRPAWENVLALEPKQWLVLDGAEIDRALAAMGAFSDLASPYLSGHSGGVADLATRTASAYGFSAAEVMLIRRAALVHDLGRAGVNPAIWWKETPLTTDEWEQIRLHPYYTERVLKSSLFLSRIGEVASCHHERYNGDGYHRRLDSSSLSRAARVLATADSFHAMTEPRSHRARCTPEEAAITLTSEADLGLHDPEMVAAVLEVSGLPAAPVHRVANLTDREAQVIGLIARGLQTKQVARALDISAKTADNHLQNAYRKMGVSTRAAATLFAVEHGLVE
jgi:HD-GYP domain-containing protein (c-di-GMP phosphodiesterase class II)